MAGGYGRVPVSKWNTAPSLSFGPSKTAGADALLKLLSQANAKLLACDAMVRTLPSSPSHAALGRWSRCQLSGAIERLEMPLWTLT